MKIIIFKNCVIIDRGHLPFNSFWCFPMTWTNLILSAKQLISQNIQMKLCLFYLPVPNWGVIKDRKLFSQSSTTYSPKLKVFSFLWALSKLLYLSFSNFSSFFFFFLKLHALQWLFSLTWRKMTPRYLTRLLNMIKEKITKVCAETY